MTIINTQNGLSECRNWNQGPPGKYFRTSAHWTEVDVVAGGRSNGRPVEINEQSELSPVVTAL